jgi:hypothetical protein
MVERAGAPEGEDDRLVKLKPLPEMVDDWRAYLHESDEAWDSIRRHERTGRPLGSPHFVADLEKMTGRELAKRPPGPKPRRSRREISCPPKRSVTSRISPATSSCMLPIGRFRLDPTPPPPL